MTQTLSHHREQAKAAGWPAGSSAFDAGYDAGLAMADELAAAVEAFTVYYSGTSEHHLGNGFARTSLVRFRNAVNAYHQARASG